jgi:hypothetical protein
MKKMGLKPTVLDLRRLLICRPEVAQEQVIKTWLAGQEVHLEEKVEKMTKLT